MKEEGFMLCKEQEEPFVREGWIAQRKFDGSRVKIHIKGDLRSLTSRRGNELIKKFPEFDDIRFDGQAVLDGEVVYFNDNGKDNFNRLLNRTNTDSNSERQIKRLKQLYPCKLVIFDILEREGRNLRKIELKNRLAELHKFMGQIEEGKDHLKMAKSYENTEELWKKVKEKNLEGIVLKDLNSKYRSKRSKKWRKVKNWKETTLEFSKYEEHEKGITLETEDEVRVNCPGQKSKEVRQILEERGGVKAEIEYLNKTKADKYRHAKFKRLIE